MTKCEKKRQILLLSVVGRGAAPPARVLWSQTLRGYILCRAGVSRVFFFNRGGAGNTLKMGRKMAKNRSI